MPGCVSTGATRVTIAQVQVYQLFLEIDLNGDGIIDTKELRKGLKAFGYNLTDAEVRARAAPGCANRESASQWSASAAPALPAPARSACIGRLRSRRRDCRWIGTTKLKAVGAACLQVHQLMLRMDLNQDGTVDFSELAASLIDWQQFQAVQEDWDAWLDRVFDRLDTDASGYVDLNEIMRCAPRCACGAHAGELQGACQ